MRSHNSGPFSPCKHIQKKPLFIHFSTRVRHRARSWGHTDDRSEGSMVPVYEALANINLPNFPSLRYLVPASLAECGPQVRKGSQCPSFWHKFTVLSLPEVQEQQSDQSHLEAAA